MVLVELNKMVDNTKSKDEITTTSTRSAEALTFMTQ